VLNDQYTILMRDNGQALIVAAENGDHYIFSKDGLACRLSGSHSLERLQPRLLRLGWVSVPRVAPYTLDGLRHLLGPAIAA
jgi:hypothetical protein